jgi:hypothetical protein
MPTGLCQNSRYKSEAHNIGNADRAHESYQLGKPLLMNTASLGEREQLVVPLLRSEKRARLTIHAAKAGSSNTVFESAHGAVTLFNPSVVLLHIIVQVTIRVVGYLIPKDVLNSTRVGTWILQFASPSALVCGPLHLAASINPSADD